MGVTDGAHGVAIDALDCAVGRAGEEMAEGDNRAQVGCADDDGHEGGREDFAADLDGAPDAAMA